MEPLVFPAGCEVTPDQVVHAAKRAVDAMQRDRRPTYTPGKEAQDACEAFHLVHDMFERQSVQHIPIQKIEPCGRVSSCQSHPSGYRSAASRAYHTATDVEVGECALRKLEEAMALDTATHEKNAPALAANKEIEAKFRAAVKEAGIPDSYLERDAKSRARIPPMVRHSAGWVNDIHRFIRTDDGHARQQSIYKDLKLRYEEFLADARRQVAWRNSQA